MVRNIRSSRNSVKALSTSKIPAATKSPQSAKNRTDKSRTAKSESHAAKPENRTGAKGKVNTFHQRLASLTFFQAKQMLGEDGNQLLVDNSQVEIDQYDDVTLTSNELVMKMPASHDFAKVTILPKSSRAKELLVQCDRCTDACKHQAAALHHLLETKTLLGLAAPPDENVALEHLTPDELLHRAIAERTKRAQSEPMTLQSVNPKSPWTDYVISSRNSGKTYRIAIRGLNRGEAYCNCPDFRTNDLGTCKHILRTLDFIQAEFSAAQLAKPYLRKSFSVRLQYQSPKGLVLNLPKSMEPHIERLVSRNAKGPIDGPAMMKLIQKLEKQGHPVHVYPDAEAAIQRSLIQQHLEKLTTEIRNDPSSHPLINKLLKAELLPYQLDGIAFVAGAGRAILADDMGLGKTIQGIGVAELLAREANIERVLVVCPASLKSQWQSEISKFSDRSSQLILGPALERAEQYRKDVFFTICNYEQVYKDLTYVESTHWDLIILDEGQRIKNWESKTSQSIRSLRSTFALVLSGTPLENRLDELFTVVRFVDDCQLGPAYQFFHKHREVNKFGVPVGYKNLGELRSALKPILLRRTRGEVVKQLPKRTDEVILIDPTEEQLELSNGQLKIAAQIAGKKYLTEMDLLRLQKALLLARMAANSSYLVDGHLPEFSTKLEKLQVLLQSLILDPTRKIVLFSEWKRMLDRIETILKPLGCDYVRLDGSVPQKARGPIVKKFQNDPECRLILMTNAGSTGLNLQSANTVVNVELPWNPAVLEQRIARAYRMGQKNPVHIYKLVTRHTIEERLLDTLASKQEMADAALDFESDVESVTMKSSIANLRERLEKILGPVPPAPVDRSLEKATIDETFEIQERRERVSAAGGQLLGAALQLVGELVSKNGSAEPQSDVVDGLTESLSRCVERDSAGRPQLTISLDSDSALKDLARTLAKLLVH